MTINEVQVIADIRFRFVVRADDGSVMFAGPLPPPFGDGLTYELSEDGTAEIPDDEIEDWIAAWVWFVTDLEMEIMEFDTPKEPARPPRHKNRTLANARKAGTVTVMRDTLAVPTARNYQNALLPVQGETAHLQPLAQDLAGHMEYRDGKFYCSGHEFTDDDLIRFHDDSLKAAAGVDLPLLYVLYSQIFYSLRDKYKTPAEIDAALSDPDLLGYGIKFYVPDFFRTVGLKPNSNQGNIDRMIAKIRSYNNIMGIIPTEWGPIHLPSMNLVGHDAETNTVEINSPYFNKIILMSIRDSIQKDRKNTPKLKSNGEPFMLPTHSHLIKTGIASERSKNAAEVVRAVVTVIEQAGYVSTGKVPHISAKTVIERCPKLRYALEKSTPGNKNNILKRTFGKAWELLETQTSLKQAYKNIRFPTDVPTGSNLGMVFEFPHEGKNTD